MNPGMPMISASGTMMISAASPMAKTIGRVIKKNKQQQYLPNSLIYLQHSMHKAQRAIGQARIASIGPTIKTPMRIRRRLM
jgi:hypothetical protein